MTGRLLPTPAAFRELGISRNELAWRYLAGEISPAAIDARGYCYWHPEDIAALAERLAERAAVTKHAHASIVTDPELDPLRVFKARFAVLFPEFKVPARDAEAVAD